MYSRLNAHRLERSVCADLAHVAEKVVSCTATSETALALGLKRLARHDHLEFALGAIDVAHAVLQPAELVVRKAENRTLWSD